MASTLESYVGRIFFKIAARTFYFMFIYVYLCLQIGSNIYLSISSAVAVEYGYICKNIRPFRLINKSRYEVCTVCIVQARYRSCQLCS